MKVKPIIALLLLVGLISCNEEITVGSSLLEDSSINVDFTDTVTVTAKTVAENRLISYRNSLTFTNGTYMVGAIDDPTFGRSSSETYLSIRIVDELFPEFDTLKIDSVVMVIPLDSLGQFGNEDAIHEISVHQLDNSLVVDAGDTLFTNQSFNYNSTPMGTYTGRVSHKDSVKIFSAIVDSTICAAPQLRVQLDTSLWHDIAIDTLKSRDADVFLDLVRGFVIRSTPNDNSMFGLNLADSQTPLIELYYEENDSTKNVYLFDLAQFRSSLFSHDYSGTPVLEAIETESDELLYIQSMQGPNIELDLVNLLAFQDNVVNRASLNLYVQQETDPVLPLVDEIEAYYVSNSGDTIRISDAIINDSPQVTIDVEGGQLENIIIGGELVKKYELDITNHVVQIIRGNISSTKIFLRALRKEQRANRSILLGPNHPEFPIEIELTISNP